MNSQQARVSVPQWLKILTPRAFPIEPLPGSGWLNRGLWAPLISEIKDQFGTQEPLIVVGKPSVLALKVLQAFKPKHSIYDAMDDFPAFYTGVSRVAMANRERQLVQAVEKVWVSSTALKSRWSQEKASVCFVPNALDDALLLPPRNASEERARKVLGYVGTVGAWFDWDWIRTLAKLRSGDIIRIIGPVFSPAPFELPSNIELLPPCAHDIALAAMCEFDVGLIPFKRNELTVSVDPIKYYEYRALGLPVVSTDFGEMKFREEAAGTFISKSLGDIGKLIVTAAKYRDTCESSMNFINDNTWDARFEGADIEL
ncbi:MULTISPECIES: glycosyl transferase [Pseudomonas]|nr:MULTISPECIES: glycosyl transferase [Pseudomonas]